LDYSFAHRPTCRDEARDSSYSGGTTSVTVIDITEETITLDGNHEIAEEELKFKIELIEIV
jgi:FKBP-type peptidyl-prolyl cis-trans isomerase 2